ncbi:neuromedin-B-like [Sceloporus undulatus]|uniref:neuromedin-B-like n=1 Tax=Sceloporus undulatus TaxID=8520 RepID=UPI001C4BFDC6|nr:neuromedin-B-like [Sceloporus undulatus]
MARGVQSSKILQIASLAYLILFSTTTSIPSPSLGDKRNGPIRLRENLWATGHFMGKKSTLGSSHLLPSSPESAESDNIPEALNPVVTAVLEDMKELMTRELLKILLQWRLLEGNQGKSEPKDQEMPSLRKLLAKYI